MCGIIARIGGGDGLQELLAGLENLEYRGYDSAGIAIKNGRGIEILKQEGEVHRLASRAEQQLPTGEIGLGHTRWSTHGSPSDRNAHPHTDCTGQIAVVHNGIIENYEALKDDLVDRGHHFMSETDTEVVPHLIEAYIDDGFPPEQAFRQTLDRLSGSYALAAVIEDEDVVYAARKGSPLVLGIDQDRYFLASDVPAFREFTDRVVYLEDGDLVIVNPDGYVVRGADGHEVNRPIETIPWEVNDAGKGGYQHYMLKEIHEQPAALRQTLQGRVDHFSTDVQLDGLPPGTFDRIRTVQFVACGTSYHAALYAARFLNNAGIPAQTFIAGEYASGPPPVGQDTLVVAVTQSGETADTLEAIRLAARADARTLVVTNTLGSTATRECDDSLFIRAGPEIGVAATKTFSSQIVALSLLGERLTRDVIGHPPTDSTHCLRALTRLPGHVQQILNQSTADAVAADYVGSEAFFFIGRGFGYPVALEAALKFKEISYEHAEGFAASELKHGPLALITSETPVIAILTGHDDERTVSNIKEVQSRGAPVIAVSSGENDMIRRISDTVLRYPETHHQVAGVLANVQLQLLAYHAARSLGRPIDKPRNLAKCVTVP